MVIFNATSPVIREHAMRISLGVDEPRGDLCAELGTLLEKVVPRPA
jgi:hypothetical protein